MTWSYSGNPADSAKDAVRFYCGDTDVNDPVMQDEEILFLLDATNQDPLRAAIKSCEQMLLKFSREVDYTIGPESVKASQRAEQYEKILARLKADLIGGSGGPIWTGDINCRPPIFDIGMHDAVRWPRHGCTD